MKNDPLLKWRKEFPILDTTTYLISNSLGAMPKSVYARMKEYADVWATRGVRAWADVWWDMSINVGDLIAPLIGAKRGEVSMHTNVSSLQSLIISCFDFRQKRDRVVMTSMEFPSVMYVYEKFAVAHGAKLNIVDSDDGISIETQKVIDSIDEKTLLVPISHVLFKSAYIQDVRAITEKAHRCGAIVILDAYHSVGTIPVDVRSLGVDILVGGVLKWLCGGPGGAFLWIRPELRKKLQPKITGWFAHMKPFAFEQSMSYRDDAAKFLNGTPSIPALYAAGEGAKIISQIGIEKVRAKSKRQTALLVKEAQKNNYPIMTPLDPDLRAGTLTLNVPHAYEISRELLRRNIIVDYREGAGIRFAPHFYNSDDEVLHAAREVKNILDTKAYRKFSKKRTSVT